VSPRIPIALTSPTPGWTSEADVIVVGSGIAGLSTAMHARRAGHRVLLVTKSKVDEGSTRWAQGGIAAALADDDSPAEHLADTLVAGAGLCDPAAVQVLAYEGAAAVRRLVRWGADFDLTEAGELALTREGGHHRDRIAHAGGDATGVEISRALVAAVAADPKIELVEHALVLDLVKDAHGAAQGLTLHVMGEGQRDGVGAALAPAVVLATGGIGQVFASSTNPSVATGDGVALGLRAGAAVADLEFTQFHPTVLWLGENSKGQQPLISEALRGEGALLIDDDGKRFLLGLHPMAELAPRDVVAKAISHKMRETGKEHVWLDATGFDESTWKRRFPNILELCRSRGIDPRVELIPVVPAQHYESGGLLTDLHGRTNIEGLFAVGECACSGVHGANRLASNSLLEGLVFADRIGSMLSAGIPERNDPVPTEGETLLVQPARRAQVQQAMTDGVGVLRTDASIARAQNVIGAALTGAGDALPGTPAWETTNLALTASVLAEAARRRQETRGSHWRDDYPDLDNNRWRVRLVAQRRADGELEMTVRGVAK
jgi:L-aspartate oxidase